MIDLHTHTIMSDGELIPSELIRRAEDIGYEAIAITDHVDHTNIDTVVPKLLKAIREISDHISIDVIAGVEITHVPPPLIHDLVKEARSLGSMLVVVHGETIVEPVKKGTNLAAIEAGIDILAHPGVMTREELLLAKDKGVYIEITSRKGHSLSNGYIAKEAQRFGVPLVINTDAHSPSDLITHEMARMILLGAGIEEGRVDSIFENSKNIVSRIMRRQYAKSH